MVVIQPLVMRRKKRIVFTNTFGLFPTPAVPPVQSVRWGCLVAPRRIQKEPHPSSFQWFRCRLPSPALFSHEDCPPFFSQLGNQLQQVLCSQIPFPGTFNTHTTEEPPPPTHCRFLHRPYVKTSAPGPSVSREDVRCDCCCCFRQCCSSTWGGRSRNHRKESVVHAEKQQ